MYYFLNIGVDSISEDTNKCVIRIMQEIVLVTHRQSNDKYSEIARYEFCEIILLNKKMHIIILDLNIMNFENVLYNIDHK